MITERTFRYANVLFSALRSRRTAYNKAVDRENPHDIHRHATRLRDAARKLIEFVDSFSDADLKFLPSAPNARFDAMRMVLITNLVIRAYEKRFPKKDSR